MSSISITNPDFNIDFDNLKKMYNSLHKVTNLSTNIIDLINNFIEQLNNFIQKYEKSITPTIKLSIDEFYILVEFITIYNKSMTYIKSNNTNITRWENMIMELYNYMKDIDKINSINKIAVELLNNNFINIYESMTQQIYYTIDLISIKKLIYILQIYYYIYNNIADITSIEYYDKLNILLNEFISKFNIKEVFNIILKIKELDKIKDKQYYKNIFFILLKIYKVMKNSNNIKTLTLKDINTINVKFKYFFYSIKNELSIYPNYDKKIKEIEMSINVGNQRNKTLQLFNEPYSNFNSSIPLKTNYECRGIIDKIQEIKKNSNSNSRIFRATYNTNPCYIKVFLSTSSDKNDNLLYEQKIYRYIKNINSSLKKYYEDNFVKIYDVFKMYNSEFLNLINHNNDTPKLYDLVNNYYYLIITEDIKGISYDEFIMTNISNKTLILNTLFDIIYGIYIMNDKLKIYHNDTHFGNILIKSIPPEEKKYQIGKIEYIRTINYRICFYDFDFSYLENELNPYNTSTTSYPQNVKSASDIWFIMKSIYLNINTHTYKYIDRFIKKIILNDKGLYSSYYYNNRHIYNYNLKYDHIFVVGQYCKYDTNCEKPDHPELYAINVLQRFLLNENYNSILNFTGVDPFYNKYIKYKQKYINLLNKL